MIHVSNLYNIEEQCLLAKELTFLSELSATFFCNSGCEANELAIKIARLHGHDLKIQQPEIIVMDNAFHGRTMATLSASGNRKVQAGFEPLMSGFVRVPFDNIDAIQEIASKKNKISALLKKSEIKNIKPDSFKRYGSARKLYNFNIDNVSSY